MLRKNRCHSRAAEKREVSALGSWEDAETFRFACEINDMLRKAGFLVSENKDMSATMPLGPPYIDVTSRVRAEDKQPVHAKILQEAFAAIDIDAPGSIGGPPENGWI